ncbi:hypothetical protein HY989_02595 [Candidatus Micrarchaeota archaeon]|nr:hypothetical protein [Candidatus Micrarchaeota archaeon]
MKKITYFEIRRVILERLLQERCFGQKQMRRDSVAKFYRESRHDAEKVIDKLIANGLILSKTKHYDSHIWLNMARLEEIRKSVLENLPDADLE